MHCKLNSKGALQAPSFIEAAVLGLACNLR